MKQGGGGRLQRHQGDGPNAFDRTLTRRSTRRARRRTGAAAIIMLMTVAATAAASETVTPARQRELLTLLRQDCGACHGLHLTGGLGPALTPDALEGKPAESLAATIVSGRRGTAMPPWRRFLTDDEAGWLVESLKSGTTYGR